MINSIIATALGLAIGTAASSSIMQPPAILHQTVIPHDIFIAHNELLRRVLVAGNPLVRRIQDESTCPGTPFLWKITEDATGNHVGFGVGTMHLPADIVTTDEAYDSIISAIGGDYFSFQCLLISSFVFVLADLCSRSCFPVKTHAMSTES